VIPFTPMSIERHRTRYEQALVTTFHSEDLERGGVQPGTCPENIFDFVDGLRLIISKEFIEGEDKPRIHVSGSTKPGSFLANLLQLEPSLIKKCQRLIKISEQRYGFISNNHRIELLGFSPMKGVPHWRGI